MFREKEEVLMGLTKNMKKVLSATLSMALVVSGVTVGTKQAKAADALKWTGSFAMGTEYAAEAVKISTDQGSTIELKGNDYNNFEVDFSVNLADFAEPVITVVGSETTDGKAHNFAVCNATDWKPVYAGNNEDAVGVPSTTTTITGKLDKSVSNYVLTAQGRTISSITITDGDGGAATPDATAAPTATAAPDATTAPQETAAPEVVKGDMDKFTAGFNYVGSDAWADQSWDENTVEVTGNGSYSVSYKAKAETQSIYLLILSTNLYKGALSSTFSLIPTYVSIGSKNYKVNSNGGWCFTDEDDTKAYRYNIVNPWNGPKQADGLTNLTTDTFIDEIGATPVAADDTITVYFTVKGMNSDNASATAAPAGVEDQGNAGIDNKPSDNTPDDNAPEEPSEVPAKLTVAKKSVTVKAGKSVTVKYTATNSEGNAVKASASTSNKKVAKVSVSSNKAIKITVPKKVKAGKKAVITVKAAGKTAKINVKVK